MLSIHRLKPVMRIAAGKLRIHTHRILEGIQQIIIVKGAFGTRFFRKRLQLLFAKGQSVRTRHNKTAVHRCKHRRLGKELRYLAALRRDR